jgi:hypothetical protein
MVFSAIREIQMNNSDEREAFTDRMDRKWSWAFHPWFFAGAALLFTIGILLGFILGHHQNVGAAVATIGAFAACCGIVTIGRPMIRMGGYQEWLKKTQIIDGGSFNPTPEELEEERQLLADAKAVQVVGPALAIVGTMVNGLSGFLS